MRSLHVRLDDAFSDFPTLYETKLNYYRLPQTTITYECPP